MKAKIILSIVVLIVVLSIISTFSELVRCLNAIVVMLLALLYFKTSQGKKLVAYVYNNIIK